MNNKIYEVIPYNSFRQRIKLTKEFLLKGITSIENLGNCLLINYSTKERCYNVK